MIGLFKKKKLNSVFLDSEHKILRIIASCQDLDQLGMVWRWINKIAEKEDNQLTVLMWRGLCMALKCRYYSLGGMDDFK